MTSVALCRDVGFILPAVTDPQILGDGMEVAYGGGAMHAVLALGTRERMRAVELIETLTAATPDILHVSPYCLPLDDRGDVVLVRFSATGDLVISVDDGKATVLAVIDVIGSLEGTA